jgi:hypothetical protein
MLVVTALLALYLALVAGLAGDFLMLVTSGMGIGVTVGSALSLVAERRARRTAVSPWDAPRAVSIERYMRMGGLAGTAVGLLLAIVDAWLLV